MPHPCLTTALEAIAFQSGDFFKDLTETVASLRGFGKTMSTIDYWDSEEVISIADIVKRYTNIGITLVPAMGMGPTLSPPQLDNNHPFIDQWIQKEIIKGYRHDKAADARAIMKTMGLNVVKGTVDLKRSWVDGVFAQMNFSMWMPRSWLEDGVGLAPEGVAAVILHEVGHAFTYMEYAGRTFTTNMVLAGLLCANKEGVISDTRTVVFGKGAELLRMSDDQRQALLNAKNEAGVTGVVLDAMVRLSRSELKYNIFDAVGSESAADQFVSRHGAARALVIAIDHFEKIPVSERGPNTSAVGNGFPMLAANALGLTMIVFMATLGSIFMIEKFLMTYILFPEYEVPEHNSLKGRYQRLLNDCLARLKNPMDQAQREQALADYDTVKAIMKGIDDDLPWLNKISYYLNPSYRNARKFHLMQMDLENIAHSTLYASAARLRSL